MGRYYGNKEHNGRSREDVHDRFDNVSCARTKPFSFDEIMSRRKRKKELETHKPGDSGDISVHFNVDKASYDHQHEKGNALNNDFYTEKFHDRYISERGEGRGEDSLSGRVFDRYISERGDIRSANSFTRIQKSVLEKPLKRISRKEEERISTKDNFLHKGKRREAHDLETKVVKGKKEKDLRVEARGTHDAERHHSRRRQGDEQLSTSSQSEKKIPRDTSDKDTNMDGRTEKSQRDNKRKYQDRVDEKHRGKHDPEKINSLESIRGKERKEALRFHYDDNDIESKRRRSKSQGRENKKINNSVTPSPMAYNPSSYDARKHMDLSSVHFKRDMDGIIVTHMGIK